MELRACTGGGGQSAPPFEWGGKNPDGAWGLDVHRPPSDGAGRCPFTQLMVRNGVSIFFHVGTTTTTPAKARGWDRLPGMPETG